MAEVLIEKDVKVALVLSVKEAEFLRDLTQNCLNVDEDGDTENMRCGIFLSLKEGLEEA